MECVGLYLTLFPAGHYVVFGSSGHERSYFKITCWVGSKFLGASQVYSACGTVRLRQSLFSISYAVLTLQFVLILGVFRCIYLFFTSFVACHDTLLSSCVYVAAGFFVTLAKANRLRVSGIYSRCWHAPTVIDVMIISASYCNVN